MLQQIYSFLYCYPNKTLKSLYSQTVYNHLIIKCIHDKNIFGL